MNLCGNRDIAVRGLALRSAAHNQEKTRSNLFHCRIGGTRTRASNRCSITLYPRFSKKSAISESWRKSTRAAYREPSFQIV